MRLLTEHDDEAGRFAADLESALLAQALAETAALGPERTKALLRCWLAGAFNASAQHIGEAGLKGTLNWEPERDGHRLIWYTPAGLACPLARIYPQENGTWAALIVAGVKDDLLEAMLSAEWGIARLTAA